MQICKRFFDKYGYAILPLLTTFLLNDLVYWGAMVLAENRYHYDFTSKLEQSIPFVPEFIYIYFACYLFWVVNYILAAGPGREFFYRFLSADIAARLVCFMCFMLMPTTNVRPELSGNSLAVQLVDWLYRMDQPANLFPSIHCMNSWFCYIVVRGRKDISRWYQWFSLGSALMVAASTVFLKQHFVLDIAGGFLLAELMWQLSWRVKYYENVKKYFEKINGQIRKKLVKL